MSKSKQKQKVETQNVEIETASPELETQLNEATGFKVPGVETQQSGTETRAEESTPVEEAGRMVVAWPGQAEPVRCPHCSRRLLGDRSTRACVVSSTGHWTEGDGKFSRSRVLKCFHCGLRFEAVEQADELG